MSANALNTYQAVKTLKEAGVGEHQAEAIVNIMNDSIGENLAAKDDLREVKQDLRVVKQDLAGVKQELRQDMKLMEQRLTIRPGGVMIAMSSLVIAAVKML